MKTIVNFLNENGYIDDNAYEVGDSLFSIHNGTVMVSYEGETWGIPSSRGDVNTEVQDILYDNYEIEMRFCDECGRPYDAGFMAGDGEYYCCEECFESMMNKEYGEGKWKATEEEGESGGFYAYLEGDVWEDTGWFYTEWY